MGRVRVTGLGITLLFLQNELEVFENLMNSPKWMTEENLPIRRNICKGLTFLLLNLEENENKEEAWKIFHELLDKYHAKCNVLRISI